MHADAPSAIASRTASRAYVPANERRETLNARRSLVQPARDLAQTRRRAWAEVHDFRLVHAIDALVLSRRRLRPARHLGELLGASEPVEADVGRNDDVRRRFGDQ